MTGDTNITNKKCLFDYFLFFFLGISGFVLSFFFCSFLCIFKISILSAIRVVVDLWVVMIVINLSLPKLLTKHPLRTICWKIATTYEPTIYYFRYIYQIRNAFWDLWKGVDFRDACITYIDGLLYYVQGVWIAWSREKFEVVGERAKTPPKCGPTEVPSI